MCTPQAELTTHITQLRERLALATQEANDADAATGAAVSELQSATDILQQLHQSVTQLATVGSADSSSLESLLTQVDGACTSAICAMQHMESASAKHTAIVHACDEDTELSSSGSAAGRDAEIAR